MDTRYMNFGHGDLSLAGSYIRQGKMVVFPTDIEYCVGATAMKDGAIERIYTATGHALQTPLIVYVWNRQQIYDIAKVSPDAEKVIDRLLPGNVTLLLPKKGVMSVYVTGRLEFVAVRMPKSEEARKFLQYAEVPVAGIGASLKGHAVPLSWRKAKAELGENVSAIMCGADCQAKEESTVIDFCKDEPLLLRQGEVTKEQIEEVLGKSIAEVDDVAQLVKTINGKLKNFRSEPVRMVLHVGGSDVKMCAYYDSLVEQGYNPVLLVEDATKFGDRNVYSFGGDPADMALRIFDCLRILEKRYNFIIAVLDSQTSHSYNILSRLTRV